MSFLKFSRSTKTIALFDQSGHLIGFWPAANNAQSSSDGPWPVGRYKFSWHSPHPGATAGSSYGINGNFIFMVPGRSGMGVHSGRSGSTDGAGRKDHEYATDGCIRTTDAATSMIRRLHSTDKLTHIIVTDGVVTTEAVGGSRA